MDWQRRYVIFMWVWAILVIVLFVWILIEKEKAEINEYCKHNPGQNFTGELSGICPNNGTFFDNLTELKEYGYNFTLIWGKNESP